LIEDPYISSNTTADSFDWRDVGVETPVRNQGSCSSDWAMAAIGAIEAQNIIKYNSTIQFSPQ